MIVMVFAYALDKYVIMASYGNTNYQQNVIDVEEIGASLDILSHNTTNFNVAMLFVNETSGEAQNLSIIQNHIKPRADIVELKPAIQESQEHGSSDSIIDISLRHCTESDLSGSFYGNYESSGWSSSRIEPFIQDMICIENPHDIIL